MTDSRDQRAAAAQRLLNDVGALLGYPRGWKSALAKRLGIARETLSALVNGRSAPSEDTLRAIEALVGVNPEYWDAPGKARFVDFLDHDTLMNFAANMHRITRQAQQEEIEVRLAKLRAGTPAKLADDDDLGPPDASAADASLETRARALLVASGQGDDAAVLHLAPRLALDVIDFLRRRS